MQNTLIFICSVQKIAFSLAVANSIVVSTRVTKNNSRVDFFMESNLKFIFSLKKRNVIINDCYQRLFMSNNVSPMNVTTQIISFLALYK